LVELAGFARDEGKDLENVAVIQGDYRPSALGDRRHHDELQPGALAQECRGRHGFVQSFEGCFGGT
jgi:hypothetical protein